MLRQSAQEIESEATISLGCFQMLARPEYLKVLDIYDLLNQKEDVSNLKWWKIFYPENKSKPILKFISGLLYTPTIPLVHPAKLQACEQVDALIHDMSKLASELELKYLWHFYHKLIEMKLNCAQQIIAMQEESYFEYLTHQHPANEQARTNLFLDFNYVKNGNTLINELIIDYFHAILALIKNCTWKVPYRSGVLLEGLNDNKLLPVAIARLYQHIESSLFAHEYQSAFDELGELIDGIPSTDKHSTNFLFFNVKNNDFKSLLQQDYANFSAQLDSIRSLSPPELSTERYDLLRIKI